jgi:uncharacterized protein (TIGR02301 family)
MKSLSHLFLSSIAIVALGSAMAMAQTVPPESAPVVAPEQPQDAPPPEASASSAPTVSQEGGPPSEVEDEPIDTPPSSQSDWAPDINLDALQQERETKVARHGRVVKPRKVLSDLGENSLGTSGWTSANADAELLSRGQRRARPVDPAKRADLAKLSRVMGSLHALRVSCAGRDDQTYRSRMATLLDLEAPASGDLRDPLVDAFNGGFQTYGRGAGACPVDARAQEANLAKDGVAVARKLGALYRPVPKAVVALPPANQPRQNVAAAPNPAAPQATPQTKSARWNTAD